MATFDIMFSDVYGIQTRFASHNQKIQESCDALAETISTFLCADDFAGMAADSTKAYFAEVHLPIARAVAALAQLMAQEYAANFFDKLHDGNIRESSYGARLDSADMAAKMKMLAEERDKTIADARGYLDKAYDAVPADEALSLPNWTAWWNWPGQTSGLESSVRRTENEIGEIDGNASESFSGENSDIQELKTRASSPSAITVIPSAM